jgi:predicted RNA binding protein YcfA (HicA-like mRNA interferase family)
MPLSGKEVVAKLMKKGWSFKSQKGSHVKLEKNGKVIIVPVHGNRDLGVGLLRVIEKQSGEQLP